MKTGLDLIKEERREHHIKHGINIPMDVQNNDRCQLSVAAGILSQKEIPNEVKETLIPYGWDRYRWDKMINKPYKERLIIAGALIVAEIDRLNAIS